MDDESQRKNNMKGNGKAYAEEPTTTVIRQ